MQVERERTISLSVDPKVNWSRPSIDVLFETATWAWQEKLAAVILSGASGDGSRGLHAVKAAGGRTIAQDPATAATPFMPQAAIDAGVVDDVLPPQRLGERLWELAGVCCQSSRRGEVRER
jgi:two-component system chemotaxis response regulator CheB